MGTSPGRVTAFPASRIVSPLVLVGWLLIPSVALAQNPIVVENALAGSPATVWDVSGAGDLSIQGFATDISVARGETVHFKIKTNATAYAIEIYRLGYYGGSGARHVGSGVVTAALPQSQPADLYDSVTGLTDCGNWAESAHWDVPAGAVSGLYVAKLTRGDTQGASHIAFIVRDDASHSDLLFKTSDATWQAYNVYGGNSLYVGSVPGYPSGHAPKVSYNRPFLTRTGGGGGGSEDWLFNAEYPMVRWLEANGYDVTYTTDVDADRRGGLIANHEAFLSVGHDEYWSGPERASVQAARDAGTHLAFFSGNEIYWKTRWEPSIDGSETPYRTLVCYKEGTLGENVCGGKCDPLSDTWTGLWRDGCAFSPPADGCRPENALSGQISWDGSSGALQISDAYKNLRFWRNTAVSALGAGQAVTMTPGSLGYEWDWQQYTDHYPAGRVLLSTTDFNGKTHHLSLYRAPSGALVFGAGTVQWSWGLDATHDRGNDAPSLIMRQATVNLFADMGVQPGSLQTGTGLVAATASGDVAAPASVIGFPAPGASLPSGSAVTIAGTASESPPGVVSGVEVSVDGGLTWQRATGTDTWMFSWTPIAVGSTTIKTRAYDDLGNLETPGSAPAPNVVTVDVTTGSLAGCPCDIFGATAPAGPAVTDNQAIEVGVKFRASVDGLVTGVRFYKGSANTGTHIGHLWSITGTQLAEATFAGETTEGWQAVAFSSPVAILAGTTYVASYHSEGYFSDDAHYFSSARTNGPLTAIANGDAVDPGNGVYVYSPTSAFPNNSPGAGPYDAPNYWVDVVFDVPGASDQSPPTVTATAPGNNATGVATNGALTATFNEALDPATVTTSTFELRDGGNALVLVSVEYDGPSRTATLTPGTLLAASSVYTARLVGGGTDPRIKDLSGNAMAADYAWSFTTAAPDNTPPTVTATSPIVEAGGVSPSAVISAVFGEGLSPSTVHTATFELRGPSPGSALVPASVAYLVYTHSVTLTPSTPLAAGTYTARLVGGATDPRIKDLAGNALAADYAWTFTVATFNCPCTVWAPSTIPNTIDAGDGGAIEVGVKLRSETDGFITGVRFFKAAANGGTHVGRLWTTGGVELGNATFVGETASGWQQVMFSTGIPITAGVTYLASVHMPQGHYSDFINGFQTGVDSPPLHALQNGVDGPNGVYRYGAGGVYPTDTYSASNYFVDVVFESASGQDETPPVVSSHTPASGATGVAVGTTVTASFNEAIDAATVDGSTFELRDGANALVAATVTYSSGSRTATLTPSSALATSTAYTATVKGGAADPRVKDVAGNALAADVTWSFTSAPPPPPPPDEGPGGPILVVGAASNPFGRYYAEILRNEGLNEFTATDISLVTPTVLAAHDVVVLGEMGLSATQAGWLSDWVDAGGTLIAMRPDPQLAGLLGITPAGGTLANKYLRVSTSSGPGAGIVGQTMQFHGTADLYTLSGATSLATLYSDAGTPTANPAVTTRMVGANGGKAIAFTYDLARSVVYTRQGNPAWEGQKRDGQIEPIRSDDLFYGNATFDPQPDWIDFGKIAIPQADEQQRLLANTILKSNLHRMPLPRFWYFPKGKKAVIVMTGDDHASTGMAPRYNVYLSQDPPGCSVDDWECVRASGYLYLDGAFSADSAAYFTSRGFEVGLHVDTGCSRWTAANLDPAYFTPQLNNFAAAYPNIPPPSSNRTHCISWSDWATQADVSVAHGIRLDVNYYYWPASWVNNRPGMFTGSGMPMRFARLDGSLIDCYQAVTQMPDEAGESFPYFVDALLDSALDATRGYYGAFTTNMHFDSYPNHGGSDAIVASAKARGVPVVSGRQMLRWLDARNASKFESLAWSAGTLSFTLTADPVARNIEAMVPTVAALGTLLGISRDASPVAYRTETLKGIEYAIFPGASGAYAATYGVDTTDPVISGVTAMPHNDGTAVVSWITDEPADSRVDFGTAPDALTLSAAETALVTSHALVLDPPAGPLALLASATPASVNRARTTLARATLAGLAQLTPNTTYYYRVTSADVALNEATYPPIGQPPLTFDTPPPPCFEDLTTAQFALGDTTGGSYVAATADGEVTLKPAVGAEFSGSALDPGWQVLLWGGSSPAVVSGGSVAINGGRVDPEPFTPVGPGHVLEFVATFQNVASQHVGFGYGSHNPPGEIYNTTPWAIFSTNAGGGLQARVYPVDHALPATVNGVPLLGVSRRYRIDWLSNVVRFYIDGTLVDTISAVVTDPMRPAAGDYVADGTSLVVDWMRMTPYVTSGTFTSRVFDALAITNWGLASWNADTPAGTGLTVSTRRGGTAVPGGSWTAWADVSNGGNVGGTSRYIQYRLAMTSTDPSTNPVVRDLAIACNVGADTDPPVIVALTATPAATGDQATLTWTTDEAATSRVDYGTSPGSLSQHVSDGALVISHSLVITGLVPGTTYYYQATSVDGSNNTATEPSVPASFTTPLVACFADATVADFAAGTLDAGTAIASSGDGEVILAPALSSEFSGGSLPAGWASDLWNPGGTVTVGGGVVSVNGTHAYPPSTSGPPTGLTPRVSLEFVATFRAGTFQNVGLTGSPGFDAPWVTFGIGNSASGVYARASTGMETLIPGITLGTSHRYRIDWTATGFEFYLDGGANPVATLALAVGGAMLVQVSDYSVDGAALDVDWLRVLPYAPSGSFLSRVYDAGSASSWGAISWTASTPTGTSLAIEVRKGNTSIPDGTWTSFAAIASGSPVTGVSRYIQYRGLLATTDATQTPALADLQVVCGACNAAAPAVIADLAASATGDAGGGRSHVKLTWSGVTPGDPVKVYRKPWGDYPLYRADHGGVPATPASPTVAEAAGWVLTAVSASTGLDAPPARGLWYYVAFVTNACGTVSTPSNPTGGTLDYLLGDVSDGLTVCAAGGEAGDDIVNTADLSALGGNYGQSFGPSDSRICMDVGPTVDYGIRSRPTPDGLLNFEDLVVYALNYEVPLPARPLAGAAPTGSPAIDRNDLMLKAPAQVRNGETFEAVLHLRGSGDIHALSSSLGWDSSIAEFVAVTPGALLTAAGGVAFSPRPGTVDAAVLGRGAAGLAGEGEIAVIRFRALRDGDPAVRLAGTLTRDADNRPLTLGATVVPPPAVPHTTQFGAVFPNPFSASLTVSFSLAHEGRARLAVYDVAGRTVRHLSDGVWPAGFHVVTWDGRDDDGRSAPSGFYVVRFEAGQNVQTRRVQSIR